MARVTVECLACGALRNVERHRRLEPGDCPRCGYVGWARPRDLSDTLRHRLRERTLESRRLRAI